MRAILISLCTLLLVNPLTVKAETVIVMDAVTKAAVDIYLSFPKAKNKPGPPMEDQCRRVIPALVPVIETDYYASGEQGLYRSLRTILGTLNKRGDLGFISGNFLQVAVNYVPVAWQHSTWDRAKFQRAFMNYCLSNIRTSIPEHGLYHYMAVMSEPNGEMYAPQMKRRFILAQAQAESRRN